MKPEHFHFMKCSINSFAKILVRRELGILLINLTIFEFLEQRSSKILVGVTFHKFPWAFKSNAIIINCN